MGQVSDNILVDFSTTTSGFFENNPRPSHATYSQRGVCAKSYVSSLEGVNAKILLIDIETSAALGWAWQMWDTNLISIHRDWSILCFSWKWLDGPIHVEAIDPPTSLSRFIGNPRNDYRLVRSLWRLLDEADVVIAHNGNSFDLKKIVSRFLYYNLPPPSPYKQVDTKVAVKRVSSNTSNKLDDLGKQWGLGQKLKHNGWDMWIDCMAGKRSAWQTMKEYNKQDVLLLEKIYKHLLPYISNHPNLDNYSIPTVCSKCGSNKGFERGGFYHTQTTKYQCWRCKNCRGQMRSPLNLQDKKPLRPI